MRRGDNVGQPTTRFPMQPNIGGNADVRERLIAEIDKDYAGRTATEVGQLLKGYEL